MIMGERIKDDQAYLLNVYNRFDLDIERAEGSYIYDTQNRPYLDMFSGIAVNAFGHHDEGLLTVLMEQSRKYIHLSNYFPTKPSIDLAKLLVKHSFASKVFFTNSGTEANEAAIKLAKKYGTLFSPEKREFLSAQNAFHGRSCGSLSITGQPQYKESFKPLLPNVHHYEFNNIEDLKAKVSDQTCAVFIEIIQGEGGIYTVSQAFIDALVQLAKRYKFLLIVDEIQTGLGRCGDLFAYEKYQFNPDIMCLAKSLGGGLPLGAMLVNKPLENILSPGEHGSTFGGNPVACALGNYVMKNLTTPSFQGALNHKIQYLWAKLNVLKENHPHIIKVIRGQGLMIGLEVGDYAFKIRDLALEHFLLLNVTHQSVIRLLPPLTISLTEINQFIYIFSDILHNINNG